ncbi:MAG: CAP domain-containing protein [Caldilineaceae bacterium]
MKALLKTHQISFRHSRPVSCICFIIVLCTVLVPANVAKADSGSKFFIPIAPNKSTNCQLNEQEQQIEAMLVSDENQQRPEMVCNDILSRVARERALDMATRDYFDHINPDGHGPNYLVREAGYILPDSYSNAADANNIESIAAGFSTAEAAWDGWMNSPSHRKHLLAEIPFYTEQVEYGIGYVYLSDGNTYHYYWVVLTAKSGQ